MAWRLAYSLDQLRSELNAQFPRRDKSSDGTIGDASHAASASDHNPNAAGVVCAFDVDTDLDGTNDSNDPQMARLCEWFRTHPHPDVKYLIYAGRMWSAYPRPPYGPFEWRPYTGVDPHTNHAHISVGVGRDGQSVQPYDDRNPWGVAACFGGVPLPQPPPRRYKVNAVLSDPISGETQIAELRDDGLVWLRNIKTGSAWYNAGPLPPNNGKPLSLDAGYRKDGTLDVSVRTDKGVTWLIGAPAGAGFGSWYVPG